METDKNTTKQKLRVGEPSETKARPERKIETSKAKPSKRGVWVTEDIANKKRDYAKTIPPRYQNQYVQTIKGTCSATKAIKAMCQHCVGYEETVFSVANCPIWRCPVYAYRPYQDKAKA